MGFIQQHTEVDPVRTSRLDRLRNLANNFLSIYLSKYMKEKLMPFFKLNPYSPITTVPILGAVFFFIMPCVSLFILNSRSLIIASTFSGIVFIPLILSYLHKINFMKIAPIWWFFVVVSIFTLPRSWEGNPKAAFADHFLPGIGLSLILSILVIIFILRKR